MRAVVCHGYGPPEELEVEELPDPVPGPGDVLVKVAYAAVNHRDLGVLANHGRSVPLPFTPGGEFSGTVLELGEDVIGLAPGDGVFGTSVVGAFAEQIVVPAGSLLPVPAGIPLARAAAFWLSHSTAFHALRTMAELRPGDWVVVLGAAGGVGLAAVELASLLGAKAIAVASNPDKLGRCAARGAVATIDYTTTDVGEAITIITGDGAHVVIDPVGGVLATRAVSSLRADGRYVSVGCASGDLADLPPEVARRMGTAASSGCSSPFTTGATRAERRDAQELLRLFGEGRLAPLVCAVHCLETVGEALRSVADGTSSGKVLIAP